MDKPTTVVSVPTRWETVKYLLAAVICNLGEKESYHCSPVRFCHAVSLAWQEQARKGQPVPRGLEFDFVALYEAPSYSLEIGKVLAVLYGMRYTLAPGESGHEVLCVTDSIARLFDEAIERCEVVRENIVWIMAAAQIVREVIDAIAEIGG